MLLLVVHGTGHHPDGALEKEFSGEKEAKWYVYVVSTVENYSLSLFDTLFYPPSAILEGGPSSSSELFVNNGFSDLQWRSTNKR